MRFFEPTARVTHWTGIMNATPLRILLLSSIAGVGCVPDFGTQNVGLTVLGVASVGVGSSTAATCAIDPGTPPLLSDGIVFDLATSDRLRLPLVVRNDWSETVAVTALDFRWVCNSNGFMNGVPALRIPSLGQQGPFCQETHDPDGFYLGFDVVAATGAPIEPGATGVIWVEVIPSVLGQGMIESFDLAVLAAACLDGEQYFTDPNTPECQAYAARLDEVLPGAMINQRDAPIFASYAFADGNYGLADHPSPPALGTGLRLQLRGLLAAVAGNDDVYSNEVIQLVEICRNCGALQSGPPLTREPRAGFECYYDPTTPQ